MELHKKSQEIGRITILQVLILLFVLIVMAVLVWKTGPIIKNYIDKLFG